MHGTGYIKELAGKKYRNSMLDFPPPATHNIVLVSNTQNEGSWNGKNITFIGKVLSLWEIHSVISIASRVQDLAKLHKVEVADITVHTR